jgi:hypothetical protein
MSERLGPLEIQCDCPSYVIVQATRRIGICSPEDVRWCRLSHFFARPPGWRELFRSRSWKQLFGIATNPKARDCFCGQPLPCLARYSFTYNSGTEQSYLLGQCEKCRTIFWEQT